MVPLLRGHLFSGQGPVHKEGGFMAEELKKLVREYEEGRVSRREFMRQAVMITGSLAAANSLIGGLLVPRSDAAQVAPNDPDVLTHNVTYEGKTGPVFGYLARPMKAGKYPGVIVIHENARTVRSRPRCRAPFCQGGICRSRPGLPFPPRRDDQSQPQRWRLAQHPRTWLRHKES